MFVRLCDKAHLHTHKRSSERQWQEEAPNSTLPGYSQAYHRGHQPMKGTFPQAQRSTGTQWQVGTQIKDSQGRNALSQPLPGLSQENHQPRGRSVEPVAVSHWEQLSRSPFGLRGVASNWGDWDPEGRLNVWTQLLGGFTCTYVHIYILTSEPPSCPVGEGSR